MQHIAGREAGNRGHDASRPGEVALGVEVLLCAAKNNRICSGVGEDGVNAREQRTVIPVIGIGNPHVGTAGMRKPGVACGGQPAVSIVLDQANAAIGGHALAD